MYQDPVIAKYIALLKAKAGGTIKTYYQGEPVRIVKENLPCAIISKRETRVGVHTNAEDEHGIGMAITIITDIRTDLSTSENTAQIVAGVATLYDIMEGRQEDLTLKPTCVLSVLRANPLVDAVNGLRTDLGTVTRVDYGETLAGRSPQEWTIEARVDFVSSFTQVR
jgi:hypothetical protein